MLSWIGIFNRVLGYGGTVASCFIKLPLILNIVRRRSYEGLSAMSMFLETSAYIANMWYNIYRQNALYTYGDLVATVIQNSIIVVLMLYFGPMGKGFSRSFLLQFITIASIYFLLIWYCLAHRYLQYLILYGSVVSTLSRLSQVLHNLQKQSVLGVQSPVTAINSFLRPCIKLYYSLTVTKDEWLILSSFINVLINAVLLCQVCWWLPLRHEQQQQAPRKSPHITTPGSNQTQEQLHNTSQAYDDKMPLSASWLLASESQKSKVL